MEPSRIRALLASDDQAFAELLRSADACRHERRGPQVRLRALLEYTNVCRRNCTYCGLRAANRDIPRYRMNEDELVAVAHQARRNGLDTVVMQGGEDRGLSPDWLARVIDRVVTETGLTVALSAGEWPHRVLALWRRAGAARYLLRFETSDARLFAELHPDAPHGLEERFRVLEDLRELGYEVGSGFLVGLPGQTIDMLADDLDCCRKLALDMVGIGPFIPHPATPLAGRRIPSARRRIRWTLASVALARLLCPESNIPATTALRTLSSYAGLSLALRGGANVLMPNYTPLRFARSYELYPGKSRPATTPSNQEEEHA